MARAAPARVFPGSVRLGMRPGPGAASKRGSSGFSHGSPFGGLQNEPLHPFVANSIYFFRISSLAVLSCTVTLRVQNPDTYLYSRFLAPKSNFRLIISAKERLGPDRRPTCREGRALTGTARLLILPRIIGSGSISN